MENINTVYIYGYTFSIMGKEEVHTEVRVFGSDYWFEKDGVQQKPETDDKPGFTRNRTICAGSTSKTQREFNDFLLSIQNDFQPHHYKLFQNNCRTYSAKLVDFLFPGRAAALEAKSYLYLKRSEASVKSSLINMAGSALYTYGKNWYDSRSQPDGHNPRAWQEPTSSTEPSAPPAEIVDQNVNAQNDSKSQNTQQTASDYIELGVQLFSAFGRKGQK